MAHLARLIACALICVVSATTDLKCFSTYSVSSNRYLNHTGIANVTTERNLGMCASTCQLDYRCVSANFAANNQECQLLTINEESTLIYDVQWIHITLRWPNTSYSNNSIKPTLAAKSKGFVSVGYNSVTDKYHRAPDTMDEMIPGWDAITFTNVNIARYATTTEPTTAPTTNPTTTIPATEEPTADIYSYLYRESNITEAEISWNFDFSDTLLRVTDLVINGTIDLYRGGNITYNICGEKSTNCIEGSGVDVKTSVFAGAKQLTVKFLLSGESEDYPILFPVSIYAPEDTFGFFVNITMTDDCQYE
ncbi:uncharacterized protein LOC117104918 [Anneissia japonica]|uniref:uncharacterized protein LOC117104918 n=1 Tax=Anneissia japonica TaxID=1529436 RepID=UPI0014257F07|nr:uncharacterized protein LOC117104918 [Anneissia japonica]